MKSIRLQDRIQNSITNSSMFWFNNMLARIFKYPDLVLVIVWVLYTALDFLTMLIMGWEIDLRFALANLIFGFLFSCAMYYWLLPKIVIGGEWEIGIVMTVLLVLFLSVLKFNFQFPEVWFWQIDFGKIWMEFLRIIQFQGLTFSVWILLAYFIVVKDSVEKKAMLDKLKFQHQSFQLGPHFVLNMMTEITASAMGLSDELSEEIEQFSILLKYSYKDLDRENSLLDEITAINAYVYCQYRRFRESLRMNVNSTYSEKTAARLPIPKMVLLTLFSDVFKHGDYLNTEFPSHLFLKLAEDGSPGNTILSFGIVNRIDRHYQLSESGFGIKTVMDVLSYYFEEDFQLFYESNEDEFSLLLTIDYGR